MYVVLIVSALALPANPAPALYSISAAMVLIMFLGIHNAWDLVTYLAVERSHSQNKSRGRDATVWVVAVLIRHH